MKVIGRLGNKYLIEGSEDEIVKLFGIRYASTREWKETIQLHRQRAGNAGLVGLEINPGYAYEQLDWLRRRNADFNELTNHLRKTADMIDSHRPLFNAIAGDGNNSET